MVYGLPLGDMECFGRWNWKQDIESGSTTLTQMMEKEEVLVEIVKLIA